LRRICCAQPFHPDRHPHGRARRDHALADAHRIAAAAMSARDESDAAVGLSARMVAGAFPALRRHGVSAGPTFLEQAAKEPWRFDFFTMMRRLERTFPDRPRIGDSASLHEEFVLLGQDPFLDFSAANLVRGAPPGSEAMRG